MDNKNKFSNEDRLYYPKGSDNINIDILNNNTRILDRIKLEARDLENVAKESTPKNIENKVLDTNSKVNSMGDTITEKLSDVAKHSTVIDIQNDTNNIYDELTNPNSMYIKGILNDIKNETTNSSTSYMNGQVQWLYNNFNGVIKSVQYGYSEYATSYTIQHSSVDVRKSFIILNAYGYSGGSSRYANNMCLRERTSTSFTFFHSSSSSNNFSWQVIEFY